MTVIRSIMLHCQTGGSDKVYALDLVQNADGSHTVNYGNGRRGSTLSTGTKVANVDLAKATKIYDKTVAEKVGKGYRPIGGTDAEDGSAAPAIATMKARATEFAPKLANPVDAADITSFMTSQSWIAQEKYDGERRGVIRPVIGSAYGANRKGLSVALADHLVTALDRLPGDTILDGEQIGDALYLFDIIRLAGEDLNNLPLTARLEVLGDLTPSLEQCQHIIIAPSATTTAAKIELLSRVTENSGEGVVFKYASSDYAAGRPNLGGSWLKHKLYKTLSAIVAGQNDQRSVALDLVGSHGERIGVGNVTIPANHPVPQVGAVVEVRYLYAYPAGGSLYQPVYLGERTDIDASECLASQRQFKGEAPLSKAA